MRRIRFVNPVPLEVLGALRRAGDVLEVDDAVADDLLRSERGLCEPIEDDDVRDAE